LAGRRNGPQRRRRTRRHTPAPRRRAASETGGAGCGGTWEYIPAPAAWLASSRGAVALLIGTQGCELLGRNARASVRGPRQGLDEVGECDDAHTLKALLLLQLVYGARGSPSAFLAVERQRHARRLRARGANDLERFAHRGARIARDHSRSEEHTSELQSRGHLVCRLLLEKK